MKLTHITRGQAGLIADNSAELHQAIAACMAAGYTITDIEDDADEPMHAAVVHYTRGPSTLIQILIMAGV